VRAYHLLALVPIATLLAAPFVANRVEPRILGLPFLLAWCVGSVLLASAVMWLIHRLDSARAEPPARGPDA
jgi:hypothetical protein